MNQKYIISLCKKYYGENSFVTCTKKENFCKDCCNHNIGFNHVEKRLNCKRKCEKIIKGISLGLGKKKNKSKKIKK